MIRTLIFGAIAGYVGKKLYDEGKLTEFKEDLVSRYQQVRSDVSSRSAQGNSLSSSDAASPAIASASASRPSTNGASVVS